MITVASNLHAAYLVCDDTIPAAEGADVEPTVFETSRHFHKLFLKAGGYGIELDLDADAHYDASGLGRVHRADAPSTICLSVPCPENPIYTVCIDKPTALSICPAIKINSHWVFATGEDFEYTVLSKGTDSENAYATVRTDFGLGISIESDYTVNEGGVKITARGEGEVGVMLPAFHFDGEKHTEIRNTGNVLEIEYKGWVCRYTVSGEIFDCEVTAANRNGYYKRFVAEAKDSLDVKIEIAKK
jgi:hypothetical protein